jgi:putative acetyltransferase
MNFTIRIDDLRGAEIAALLQEHLNCMAQQSPRESIHALDLDGLRRPEITFWTIWEGASLAGCGALKQLESTHGEVKSMRTARSYLRRGIATRVLGTIISEARRRGYVRLSLETGSMPYFEPAHALYHKAGFRECPPFGSYRLDPNSKFFTLEL